MRALLRSLINKCLEPYDFVTTRKSNLILLNEYASEEYDFFLDADPSLVTQLLKLRYHSKAQLKQDLLVLALTGFKRDGYFVEFGATDGITLSNTILLEKEYGWSGILAQPGMCWHNLLKDRRSASIDTRCVWGSSGLSLKFCETDIPELSSVQSHSELDGHKDFCAKAPTYISSNLFH